MCVCVRFSIFQVIWFPASLDFQANVCPLFKKDDLSIWSYILSHTPTSCHLPATNVGCWASAKGRWGRPQWSLEVGMNCVLTICWKCHWKVYVENHIENHCPTSSGMTYRIKKKSSVNPGIINPLDSSGRTTQNIYIYILITCNTTSPLHCQHHFGKLGMV